MGRPITARGLLITTSNNNNSEYTDKGSNQNTNRIDKSASVGALATPPLLYNPSKQSASTFTLLTPTITISSANSSKDNSDNDNSNDNNKGNDNITIVNNNSNIILLESSWNRLD